MASNVILEATDSNFDQEVLQSETPVLVDFWAGWCGPCKALGPIVEEVATAYTGRVKVAKMDVDRNSSTPMRYSIRGIPALLLFKGGKVIDQIVGYVPRDTIEKSLDKALASVPPSIDKVSDQTGTTQTATTVTSSSDKALV